MFSFAESEVHGSTCMNASAGADSPAPLSISTRWSSPEIQKARDRKQETMEASTASDVWAFGVMGYELLTEKTAFAPGMPKGTIRRMLIGRAPLPWEDHSNSSDLTDDISDNELKGIVLSCLARKPEIRPTAEALALTLRKLVDAERDNKEAAAAAAARAATAAALAAPPMNLSAVAAADACAASDIVPGSGGGFLDSPLVGVHGEPPLPTDGMSGDEAEGLKVGPAGLAVAAKGGGMHDTLQGEDTSAFDTQEMRLDGEQFNQMRFGARKGSRLGSRVVSRAPSGGSIEGGELDFADGANENSVAPSEDSVTAMMW
jgi:Protein tyrosine and serine/threonine kinase